MTWFSIGAALGGGMAIGDCLGSVVGKLLTAGPSYHDAYAPLEKRREEAAQEAIAQWKWRQEMLADPDLLLDEKIRQYVTNFPDISRIEPRLRLTSADFDRMEQKYPEFYHSRFGRL
ncbi:MAG TPA: hypothetical protein VJA21_12165 [Verrucomicrobiae bacterium]